VLEKTQQLVKNTEVEKEKGIEVSVRKDRSLPEEVEVEIVPEHPERAEVGTEMGKLAAGKVRTITMNILAKRKSLK